MTTLMTALIATMTVMFISLAIVGISKKRNTVKFKGIVYVVNEEELKRCHLAEDVIKISIAIMALACSICFLCKLISDLKEL